MFRLSPSQISNQCSRLQLVPKPLSIIRALSITAPRSKLSRPHKRLPSLGEIKQVDIEKYFDQSIEKQQLDNWKFGHTDIDVGSPSLIKSFLYGSHTSKSELTQMEKSFSQALSRGQYVHELVFHKVKPENSVEYFNLISKTYPQMSSNENIGTTLVGSWRVVVGDMDTYVHIWQYEGYPGFHKAMNSLHDNDFYLDHLEAVRPMLYERRNELMQEFSFWGGTAAPHKMGGVFEMRTYELKPGQLQEWEHSWAKGIECRRKVMEPVGAWFSQLGLINRVHHIWQFSDLEHRKISREKSWEISGWSDTVHETVKLIDHMEANVLVALPFSPLK